MSEPNPSTPFRPPLAYRVGVSGARSISRGCPDDAAHGRLSPEALARIEERVGDALDIVRRRCEHAAAQRWASAVHAVTDKKVRTQLTVLSPLAAGADRLVARAAVERGFALRVAMPFDRDDYEKTFEGDLADFQPLMDRAAGEPLVLDGAFDPAGEKNWLAFEALGRLVVRNCDLLVAIWDEARPPGRGGTEDTLRFAARVGVPIWWIHPSPDREPVLVTREGDLRGPRDPASARRWRNELWDLVGREIEPPRPRPPRHRHGPLDRAAEVYLAWQAGGDRPSRETGRLASFLAEAPLPERRMWRAFRGTMRLLTPRRPGAGPPDDPPGYWGRVYAAPDRLAGAYAARYRSSYVYVLVLAAVSLVAAAAEWPAEVLDLHRSAWAIGAVEFASLVAIFAIALVNRAMRWHERWISYRLLAELCRKQQALASLGWTLPKAEVRRAASPGLVDASWIDWYFRACVRAAPLVAGPLGDDLAGTRESIERTLLRGQVGYHQARAPDSECAARRLSKAGTFCFVAILFLAFVKLLVPETDRPVLLSTIAGLAAAFAALSAGFFALRAYAELELLADQSERMVALLDTPKARIGEPADRYPLASQDLGRDLFHLATAMLADVSGWAQLFSMKVVETG